MNVYQVDVTFSSEQSLQKVILLYSSPYMSSTQSYILATTIDRPFCFYYSFAGQLKFFHQSILTSDRGYCGLIRNILSPIDFFQASLNSIQYYSERQRYRSSLQSKKPHSSLQPFQSNEVHIHIPPYGIELPPFQYKNVNELHPPEKLARQEDLNTMRCTFGFMIVGQREIVTAC